MKEIKYLETPLVREILEQQRMILEMQKALLKRLAHPPLVYKEED